ncbi:MAG TPA: hypothetical protein DCM14_00960 [Clostridiales bacterium UBA8153]|nr:hypothetical protein [Clostridiales bacterium UBA8153]
MAWGTGVVLATLVIAPAAVASYRLVPPLPPAAATITADPGAPGHVIVHGTVTGSVVFTGTEVPALHPATMAGPGLAGGGSFRTPRSELLPGHSRVLAIVTGTGNAPGWPSLRLPVGLGVGGPLRIFYLAGLLALALVVLAVAPRPLQLVAGTIQAEPAHCALWGLATFALMIPSMFLSAITIIGIPIALGLLLALAIVGLMGYAGLCLFLGSRIVGRGRDSAAINPAWPLMVGAVILAIVTGIPLVGQVVSLGLSLVGTGAVMLSRFGRKPPVPIPSLPGNPGLPDQPSNV